MPIHVTPVILEQFSLHKAAAEPLFIDYEKNAICFRDALGQQSTIWQAHTRLLTLTYRKMGEFEVYAVLKDLQTGVSGKTALQIELHRWNQTDRKLYPYLHQHLLLLGSDFNESQIIREDCHCEFADDDFLIVKPSVKLTYIYKQQFDAYKQFKIERNCDEAPAALSKYKTYNDVLWCIHLYDKDDTNYHLIIKAYLGDAIVTYASYPLILLQPEQIMAHPTNREFYLVTQECLYVLNCRSNKMTISSIRIPDELSLCEMSPSGDVILLGSETELYFYETASHCLKSTVLPMQQDYMIDFVANDKILVSNARNRERQYYHLEFISD